MKNYIKEQIKKSYETKQSIYNDENLLLEIEKVVKLSIKLYNKKISLF